jgi:hypothetical protein
MSECIGQGELFSVRAHYSLLAGHRKEPIMVQFRGPTEMLAIPMNHFFLAASYRNALAY